MNKKQQDSWFSRMFHTRIFVTAGCIALAVVVFGYGRAFYQDYKIKQEIQQLQEEVRQLETKKIESLKLLDYVTSDQFVEETARTELNMKLPGEKVVVLSNTAQSDSTQSIATDSSQRDTSTLSNLLKWWYYMTHQ